MTRTQCEGVIDYNRCKNIIRSRVKHRFCRACHRRTHQVSRPIESREVVRKGYRRNKARRGITARAVPKVIANRNQQKANKNAKQT